MPSLREVARALGPAVVVLVATGLWVVPVGLWAWDEVRARVRARAARWRRWRLERRLTREQYFITYCRACRAVLNDQAADGAGDLYAWTCQTCGARSVFDLSYPAPVLVEFLAQNPDSPAPDSEGDQGGKDR